MNESEAEEEVNRDKEAEVDWSYLCAYVKALAYSLN
jgi:hypothetical protein